MNIETCNKLNMNIATKMILFITSMLISVLTWNVRGVLYGTDEINKALPENVDVLAIQEHWLHSGNIHELSRITNYNLVNHTCANSHTNNRGHGGVAILQRNSSVWTVTSVKSNSEYYTAVQVHSTEYEGMYIIACRLPSTNVLQSVYFEALHDLMDHFDFLSAKGPTVIVGDMNSDIGKAIPLPRDKALKSTLEFRNLIHSTATLRTSGPGYTYRNRDATCKSLIDYIIIPSYMQSMVKSCSVFSNCSYDVSDHYPCSVTIQCTHSHESVLSMPRIQWQKATTDNVDSYKNTVNVCLSDIETINVNTRNSACTIEQLNHDITNAIIQSANINPVTSDLNLT